MSETRNVGKRDKWRTKRKEEEVKGKRKTWRRRRMLKRRNVQKSRKDKGRGHAKFVKLGGLNLG